MAAQDSQGRTSPVTADTRFSGAGVLEPARLHRLNLHRLSLAGARDREMVAEPVARHPIAGLTIPDLAGSVLRGALPTRPAPAPNAVA